MPKPSLSQRFGAVVRRRRLELGLTQEGLADAAGLHPTYVGMVERGTRNVTVDVAARLASGLGVTLTVLVQEAEKSHSSTGKGN